MSHEIIGKWNTIDETSLFIERNYIKRGNLFKGHILSFFDRQHEDSLKFCLVEMTTLLNANAIGEVYIFSHLPDSEANHLREQYKQIIKKVKSHEDFKNASISAYKAWYCKKTWIYIGHNPNAKNVFSDSNILDWNNDGEDQREERVRAHYATLTQNLSDDYIEKYLNYYVDLLKSDFGFDKYEHFAVIVKPLSLIDEKEIIPVGNLYLHFVTAQPFTEEIYMQFLNEFINIYMKAKGGRLIKEFEVAAENSAGYLPPYLPNIDIKLSTNPTAQKLKAALKEHYNSNEEKGKENYNNLYAKRGELRTELEEYCKVDGKFSKDIINQKPQKNFPILLSLQNALKGISVRNALKSPNTVMDNYILLRHVIMTLLCCYELTPAEVHSFCYGNGLRVNCELSLDNYYQFYYNKLFLWVKLSEGNAYFSKDLVKANIIKKQGSKLEQDFIEYFSNK